MDFSVCAEMMYTETEFLNRLEKIKKCGFDAIEFWQWRNKNLTELKAELKRLKMEVSAFCLDSGDEQTAKMISKNALNNADSDKLFSAAAESIKKAKLLNCKKLIVTVGDFIDGESAERQIETVKKNLKLLGGLFEENGMILLVEPINRQERPKYLLPNANDVAKMIKDLNLPSVKLLYDIYHQSMENDFDVCEMLKIIELVGHVHVADCPGRGEPGTGETDYDGILKMLKDGGYKNKVGLEFVPKNGEENAFSAVKSLCTNG